MPILSKSFCKQKLGSSITPYTQVMIGKESFAVEFYPDITTMEVCYQSTYSYGFKCLQKYKKATMQYEKAFYAVRVGEYAVKKQAHAYDDNTNSNREIEITHTPTGMMTKTNVFDRSFSFSVDSQENLLIAQRNE